MTDSPGLLEAARDSRLVVIERREELLLSRAAEALVQKRHCELLETRDSGHQLSQVLEVFLPDLGPSSHHECSQNDDPILAFTVPLPSAPVIEEAVAQLVAVELGTRVGDDGVENDAILRRLVVGSTFRGCEHIGLVDHSGEMQVVIGLVAESGANFDGEVDVTVALEDACANGVKQLSWRLGKGAVGWLTMPPAAHVCDGMSFSNRAGTVIYRCCRWEPCGYRGG